MDANGDNQTNLTRTGGVDEFGADWSPNGTKIAFTSYRFSGMMGIAAKAQDDETFAPDAVGPEALAREAAESKDHTGEPQEDVEVSVIGADGKNREDLTASRAYDFSPAFSPNGTKIVFSRMTFERRGEPRSDLVVMRADGSNKRQLTGTPRTFEYEPDWQPTTAP